MAHVSRIAAIAGLAAAASMAATPAAAADFSTLVKTNVSAPIATPGVFDAEAVNADGYRRYRGYRRHRVDAGDVLAGVLIIGGIAAIANAASKNNRDRRYRDADYRDNDRRYQDRDYRDRRNDPRSDGARGINSAVNQCVSRIERDVRVDSVDGVDRTSEGWVVTGSIFNGDSFACNIDSDGQIDDISYGAGFASNNSVQPKQGNQHSDDRYAAAWGAADRGEIRAPQAVARANTDDVRPAYPGGPLPGEELSEDDAAEQSSSEAVIDGDLVSNDDRYRTAEAPDFTG
jgi:hypothetical protein